MDSDDDELFAAALSSFEAAQNSGQCAGAPALTCGNAHSHQQTHHAQYNSHLPLRAANGGGGGGGSGSEAPPSGVQCNSVTGVRTLFLRQPLQPAAARGQVQQVQPQQHVAATLPAAADWRGPQQRPGPAKQHPPAAVAQPPAREHLQPMPDQQPAHYAADAQQHRPAEQQQLAVPPGLQHPQLGGQHASAPAWRQQQQQQGQQEQPLTGGRNSSAPAWQQQQQQQGQQQHQQQQSHPQQQLRRQHPPAPAMEQSHPQHQQQQSHPQQQLRRQHPPAFAMEPVGAASTVPRQHPAVSGQVALGMVAGSAGASTGAAAPMGGHPTPPAWRADLGAPPGPAAGQQHEQCGLGVSDRAAPAAGGAAGVAEDWRVRRAAAVGDASHAQQPAPCAADEHTAGAAHEAAAAHPPHGPAAAAQAAGGAAGVRAGAAAPGVSPVQAAAGKQGIPAEQAAAVEAAPKKRRLNQLFDFLLVLDIEATCDRDKAVQLQPQEIIELSCVVVDTAACTLRPGGWQRYVKPDQHPQLTEFCTELTGITQDTVDAGVPLKVALAELDAWLREQGLLGQGKTFVPATWRDWDLKVMMASECKWRGLQQPKYLSRWVDLSAVWFKHSNKRGNLRASVEAAGLEWEGRAHSAIDDARNTARLALKLMRSGVILGVTGSFGNLDASGRFRQGTLLGLATGGASGSAGGGKSGGAGAGGRSGGGVAGGRGGGGGVLQAPARKKRRVFDEAGAWNGNCYCGARAKKRTVKRPGANNGRDFWSCGHFTMTGGATCDFFKFVSDVNAPPAASSGAGRHKR